MNILIYIIGRISAGEIIVGLNAGYMGTQMKIVRHHATERHLFFSSQSQTNSENIGEFPG